MGAREPGSKTHPASLRSGERTQIPHEHLIDAGFAETETTAIVWETDANGNANYVSQSELDYTGCDLQRQLGSGWIDVIHPDDAERFVGAFREALQKQQPFGFVCRRRRFDGEYFWFKSHGVPQFNEERKFSGFKGFCLEITQQLETQSELKTNQRKLRSILDNSPYLVAFIDCDLKYRYVNNKYARFWRKRADQIIGQSVSRLAGESYALILPFLERALNGETVVHEMGFPIDGGQQVRWLDVTHVPAFDANGLVDGFYCFANEVTESRSREKLLQLVQDHVPALMVLLNRKFELRYANNLFLRTYSVSATDIVDKHLKEVVGEEAFENSREHLLRALEGEKVSFEIRQKIPGGRTLDGLVNLVPELDSNQVVIGICGLISNVSHLKMIEKQLKRSEQRFDLAVSGSSVGVFELDLERPDWIYADHLEDLLGFARGELKNSRAIIRALIHPDDLEQNDAAKRLVEAGSGQTLVHRLKTKSNEYRWFKVSTRHKIDAEGKPQRLAGTITDINELKVAQLEAADQVRRRDQFLAMLSHELRNPMAAITFSLDYFNELDSLPTESKKVVDIMTRQSAQISRLLDDLLDVSRVTHNRIEFQKATHDIGPTIRDTVETLLPGATAKRQTVTLDLLDHPLIIDGDESRLKQVIVNLVDNAIKYTNSDGEIRISTKLVEGQLMISVRDSGIGIPEEAIGKIFDLFFQCNQSMQRSYGGMGVGLFMVNHIVKAHGGMIMANSDGPDLGSQFDVCLPISVDHLKEARSGPSTRFDSKRVALVEDNDDSRQMMSELLGARGFLVTEFSDGMIASLQIPVLQPDVAIIDIGLPGKNGLMLARDFRQDRRMDDTLLVALTGYGQTTDRELVASAGYDVHMVKPANIDELCQAIADLTSV